VLADKLYGFQDNIESNALNVHIYHLRQKIGAEWIQTVRGVGYIFQIQKERFNDYSVEKTDQNIV
jgi:DNA-binding response OmpR family regulator